MGEGKTEAENRQRVLDCINGKKCLPPSDGGQGYQQKYGLKSMSIVTGSGKGLPQQESLSALFVQAGM